MHEFIDRFTILHKSLSLLSIYSQHRRGQIESPCRSLYSSQTENIFFDFICKSHAGTRYLAASLTTRTPGTTARELIKQIRTLAILNSDCMSVVVQIQPMERTGPIQLHSQIEYWMSFGTWIRNSS